MREGAFFRSAGMPKMRPLVSILIRTMRGRLGKLREAVQSVINQTYSPIELIVVEDGSDCADKFLQTVGNSGHIHSVNYRSAPKMGRSKVGNVALSMASGELIGFLDDDDLLFADHVETLVSELLNNPEVSGAYAMAFEVKTEALSNEPWRYREVDYNVLHRQDFSKAVLWDHNYIPIQSIIFRRRFADDVDGFAMFGEALRGGINPHRPHAGVGIQRVGVSAELFVDFVFEQAMHENHASPREFLLAPHLLFDELAVVNDELHIEALHEAARSTLAAVRLLDAA